ncbi:MAG: hypothetical protein U0271_47635 [Polyangiaceae bacterium]
MKRRWVRVLAVVLQGALLALGACGHEPRRAVRSNLPLPYQLVRRAVVDVPPPPHQRDPWMPPATSLPEDLIRTTELLYTIGLADPRGCDYREVDIVLPPGRIHAWVMPDEAGETRYAIGLDGLVYPIFSAGRPANLQADVAAAMRQGGRAPQGEHQLDYRRLQPLLVALLLRMGEASLAEEAWAKYSEGLTDLVVFDHLETAFLLAEVRRAGAAHLAGFDVLTVRATENIARMAPVLQSELDAHAHGSAAGLESELSAALDFATALGREARRRLSSAGDANQDLASLDVHALIGELDQVSTWKIAADPIARALTARGDEAVLPLIECLDSDTRLTRAGDWARASPHEVFSVISVAEVAIVLLTELLEPTVGWDAPSLPRQGGRVRETNHAPRRHIQSSSLFRRSARRLA